MAAAMQTRILLRLKAKLERVSGEQLPISRSEAMVIQSRRPFPKRGRPEVQDHSGCANEGHKP